MVVPETDRQQLQSLLKDTITLMCCNTLSQCSVRQINALIGVTLDNGEVLLVTINESGVSADEAGNDILQSKSCKATAESSTSQGSRGVILQSKSCKATAESSNSQSSWGVKVEVDAEKKYHTENQRTCYRTNVADDVAIKQEASNQDYESGSDDCKLIDGGDEATSAQYGESSINQSMGYDTNNCLEWQTMNKDYNREYTSTGSDYSSVRKRLNSNSRYSFTGLNSSGKARSTGHFVRRRVQSSSQKRAISINSHRLPDFTPSKLNLQARDTDAAESHAALMDGRALFACTACTWVFDSQTKLRNHVNGVHLRVKASYCPDCGESFTWPSGLFRHRKRGLCPMLSADRNGEFREETE